MKRKRFQKFFSGATGLVLYVATNGNDGWSGRQPTPTRSDGPFASLERARDEIRKTNGEAIVFIRGGRYPVTQTFTLSAADAGTTYQAYRDEKPIFTGGVRLTEFKHVQDPALPRAVRQVDLNGVATVIPFQLGGFASGNGFHTRPAMELFCDGKPLPRSRWPKDAYAKIAGVSTNEMYTIHGVSGSKTGPFTYEGDRPARWQNEKYAMLYGFWFWDWADSYERIAGIDPGKREIAIAGLPPKYGFRQRQRWRAVNLLSEIAEPGEWYIDEAAGILYLYPPSRGQLELSALATPFVRMENADRITWQGITWELGAADGIQIAGGKDCRLVGCTIRRCAGNGVEISGGTGHAVQSCDIYSLGRGGVIISGGDRRTLTPGGHVVENCHIHDLSRIDQTYTPGVLAIGVGHRIAHNLIHDIPSSSIRVSGNDHVIEFNEVFRVVGVSDDQGGIDMWGDPTYRGNTFRYNYWHHIGNPENKVFGQAGIRLDDAISGVRIEGNVFYRCARGCFGGVQIHGGKDNVVTGNLFVDCQAAVSFNPWDEKRWRNWLANPPEKREAIDHALYVARYPELATLADNLNRNEITQNLVYRCKEFLLRAPPPTQQSDNVVTDKNPGYPNAVHGGFTPSRRVKGLPAIPFAEIGLYRDADRRALPTQLIRLAREGG